MNATNAERSVLDPDSVAVRGVLGALAAYHIVVVVLVALARMRYPFELEWNEGASLEQMLRLLEHKPLYGAPTVENVPFLYPPLYYVLSAGASLVLGRTFLALRAVSLAASLGTLAVVFAFVRRETGDGRAALYAAGLYAATYRASGAWMDVARVDALFLFFLLLALHLATGDESGAGPHVGAGVALSLAFLTKQTAVIPAAVLLAYYLVFARRRILPFALGLMLAVAVTVVVDRRDSGWFLYYMFGIAIAHQIKWSYLLLFWTRDMFTTVPIAMVLGGVVLLPGVVSARRRYAYLAVAAGLLVLSWRARMNVGGYLNSLMPAFALLSLLFGIGWHAVRAEQADEAPSARRATAPWLTLAILAQLAFLVTNPRSVLPSAADRAAGNTLISALAADAGEVWVPAHPYLTRLAGKTPFAHEMAISDVLLDPGSEATRELRASVERALTEHRFTAIVLDGESLVRRDVERCYAPATPVFTDPGVFWPATGWRTRPTTVYLPRASCS